MVLLKLFLIVLVLLGIGFAGLAIKIWGKTGGKFDGTCASQNPTINPEGDSCSFCGRVPDELHTCERTKVSNFVNKFKVNKEVS
ncbi:MAG: membrane or secreted protein [Flavobacteriales bacterium]|nr:membrane or secreted protein [Flavobacteriales bacterium]